MSDCGREVKLYKLTDSEGYTRRGKTNETKWGPSVTRTAAGDGGLCTDGVIHAYEHPLVAVFMNPAHADLRNPLLWESEGFVTHREGQLKCGCKTLTTVRQVDLPSITTEQCISIAIHCARTRTQGPTFARWAKDLHREKDHSAMAEWAALRAAAWAENMAAEATELDLLAIIEQVLSEEPAHV